MSKKKLLAILMMLGAKTIQAGGPSAANLAAQEELPKHIKNVEDVIYVRCTKHHLLDWVRYLLTEAKSAAAGCTITSAAIERRLESVKEKDHFLGKKSTSATEEITAPVIKKVKELIASDPESVRRFLAGCWCREQGVDESLTELVEAILKEPIYLGVHQIALEAIECFVSDELGDSCYKKPIIEKILIAKIIHSLLEVDDQPIQKIEALLKHVEILEYNPDLTETDKLNSTKTTSELKKRFGFDKYFVQSYILKNSEFEAMGVLDLGICPRLTESIKRVDHITDQRIKHGLEKLAIETKEAIELIQAGVSKYESAQNKMKKKLDEYKEAVAESEAVKGIMARAREIQGESDMRKSLQKLGILSPDPKDITCHGRNIRMLLWDFMRLEDPNHVAMYVIMKVLRDRGVSAISLSLKLFEANLHETKMKKMQDGLAKLREGGIETGILQKCEQIKDRQIPPVINDFTDTDNKLVRTILQEIINQVVKHEDQTEGQQREFNVEQELQEADIIISDDPDGFDLEGMISKLSRTANAAVAELVHELDESGLGPFLVLRNADLNNDLNILILISEQFSGVRKSIDNTSHEDSIFNHNLRVLELHRFIK